MDGNGRWAKERGLPRIAGHEQGAESVRALCRQAAAGQGFGDALTEEIFSQHLYTRAYPDPDLLIRTSGELRLSNFLLWQLSYTEIYVTEKMWPDFGKEDLRDAISEFN